MLVFNKEHNLNKLNAELIAGCPFLQPEPEGEGFRPVAYLRSIGDEIQIRTTNTLTTEETDTITAIINAHNPTPAPQPPTEAERLEALELALLEIL